ncbi:alpha-N-acetylgalactosaminide alpha-2,6-sialyltransferase 2 [Lepisosteus oculatus]|nr:PREDICTED: alpha-N-acetylgalactosaminide alpha-2,6-sialyltransferase 2-like [Lepisosteus oculatus]XP_015212205.1 PREDICTED: alpha-N-acetylgalactosaminide alpha-2,6-sialyltransferase 2-like [Lepisosteus oculatus]
MKTSCFSLRKLGPCFYVVCGLCVALVLFYLCVNLWPCAPWDMGDSSCFYPARAKVKSNNDTVSEMDHIAATDCNCTESAKIGREGHLLNNLQHTASHQAERPQKSINQSVVSAWTGTQSSSLHSSNAHQTQAHVGQQPVQDQGSKPQNADTPKLQMKVQPKTPTDPPFIGDKYTREDTIPQTNCSVSIRRRFPKTSFREKYLEWVPVLQWKKHGTEKEYHRLSQYNGAHGWSVLSFNTLKAALSLLNTTANQRMFDDWDSRSNKDKCIRCAVVGNGGILKDSKKGKEIDQHDYVFRTNGAVIKGFEEDVGSRTSFYTFSTNTMRNSMRSYAHVGYHGPPLSQETRYIFLPDHDRDYILLLAAVTHTPIETGPDRSKTPPTFFGDHVTAEKFKVYHPDFIRYIRNRFLRSRALKTNYRDLYRPSTGAVMLLAAVHTCDQVSAYGFMTPDYTKYSDHYYDTSYHKVVFYINHDLQLEMNLWQQLHKEGIIKLYMRQ